MRHKFIVFSFFIFPFPFLILFSGCASEYNLATERQEALFYSTEKEVNLGRSIARSIEKQYKLLDDVSAQARVDKIGQAIAAVCDRKDLVYYFKALDDKEVNAVSLPGGYVYINRGLLDIASDDELACIIGHEVSHIVARHAIKKLQASMGYMLARILAAQAGSVSGVVRGADMAFGEIMLGYSREDELLADKVGIRYAKEAGYSPGAMLGFLEKLKEVNRKKPPAPLSYARTHPYASDRITKIKQELGENISFTDYINSGE